jgi:hypothetical protein
MDNRKLIPEYRNQKLENRILTLETRKHKMETRKQNPESNKFNASYFYFFAERGRRKNNHNC